MAKLSSRRDQLSDYDSAWLEVMRGDGKGKKCGEGYIPANRVCRVGQSGSVPVKKPPQAIKPSDKTSKTAGNRSQARSFSAGVGVGMALTGAVAGATALGVSKAVYNDLRKGYRENFAKSAELAKQEAKKVKVDDVPEDQTHVTFTVGGFNVGGKGGFTLEKELKQAGFEHHTVPIETYEFDTRTVEEKEQGKEVKFTGNVADFVVRGNKAFFRSVVQKGYNPVSVDIAAKAYAYHQKYPDKVISLVGHSAGGIASHEAAEILQKMGVKAQVLAIGSPYFGMTEPTQKSMTIASRKDPVVAAGNVMQPRWTKSKGHGVEDYFSDPASVVEMQKFLGGVRKRRDSTPQPTSTPQSQPVNAAQPQPAADPQIAQALKQVIESVYDGGIEQLLSYASGEGGEISGQFRDGGQVYDFSVSPDNELSYVEANLAKRTQPTTQPQTVTPKADSHARLDQRKCTEGKPCGGSCIAKGKRCKVKLNANAANLMNQIRQRVQQGGAASGSQMNNPSAVAFPVIPAILGGLGKSGAIAAGAALIGVPTATYAALRANYRAGFDESARQAKEMATGVDVPDLKPDKSHVTFAVGGFAGDGAGGERLAKELQGKDLGLQNHHIQPLRNDNFDVRTMAELKKGISRGKDDENPVSGIEFPLRAMRTFMRTVLQQGRNPVAVQTAAQAYAYHQKYPDKPITLVGHSAGGITVRETAEILEKMGVKAKVIAIGSPYFGLTEPTADTITLSTKQDPILQATGNSVMKGAWFNSVKGHQIKDYLGNSEVREFLKLTLNPLSEAEAKKKRGDSRKKAVCKEGKPCGDICIPKTAKCKSETASISNSGEVSQGQARISTQDRKALSSLPTGVKAGAVLGSAILGLSGTAYLAQRARYQQNFAESVKMAKAEAERYSSKVPEDVKAGFRTVGDQGYEPTSVKSRLTDVEPDQITFFTGGFGGVSGKESDYLGEEFSEMFPKHHVVAVESPEFDITPKEGDKVSSPSFIWRAAQTLFGDSVKQGRNPVAVRIAARAYAYHQQHPDKPINLVGQSGGTMPTREAAEILERMGVKDVRVVSAAGPYFGMTKPRGMTLISKKDPMNTLFGSGMPGKRYISSVDGHSKYFVVSQEGSPRLRAEQRQRGEKTSVTNQETQKVLTDYFDRSKRQDGLHTDSGMFGDAIEQKKRFLSQLKLILERSYTDGIDQFLKIDIDANGDISGRFRDGRKVIDFSVGETEIETKLATPARTDAYLEGAANLVSIVHLDAPRRGQRSKPKCTRGMSCGYACIQSGETCRIRSSSLTTAAEYQALRTQATALSSSAGKTAPSDPWAGKSIRDLKKEASKRGVYRYSEMNSEELKRAIRAADENPKQQDRLRKTLEKRKQARDIVEGGSINKYVKSWDKIEKLLKLSGADPKLVAGALIAAFTGLGVKVYNDLRDSYRSGIRDSAVAATYRAEKVPSVDSKKNNITFAVGGFSGEGSSGAEIKKRLEDLADKPDADASDRWFRDQNEIIPLDVPEFDIEPFAGDKRNTDGTYNPAYLAHLGQQGFGAFMRNYRNKRNEAAVELASQIYAQANAKNRNGRFINKNKPINIVAHSSGGMTAREAMDIIALMPNGKEVLERVNLVTLGTPDLGFSEKRLAREMSITGAGDPLAVLPQRYPKRINSIKGREISDFLSDENAIEQIRRQFGYYPTSTYYRERPKDKPKKKAGKQAQTARTANPPNWLDPKNTGTDDPRKQPDWASKSQQERDQAWEPFKKSQQRKFEQSKERKKDLKAQGRTTKEIEDILRTENLWFDSMELDSGLNYFESFREVLACR